MEIKHGSRALASIIRFCGESEDTRQGWLYSTAEIVMVYFWAVVHDRPMCWATDKCNWPEDLGPRCLPSQSQLSRRMRGADVVELMVFVENTFVAMIGADQRLIRIIDGKPLEVSNISKDPDAGYGRSAGGKHKGYKLHVVHAGGPTPLAWGLAPMNTSEKVMAAKLIPDLPSALSQLSFRVEKLEFTAGVFDFHLPVNAALGRIDIG